MVSSYPTTYPPTYPPAPEGWYAQGSTPGGEGGTDGRIIAAFIVLPVIVLLDSSLYFSINPALVVVFGALLVVGLLVAHFTRTRVPTLLPIGLGLGVTGFGMVALPATFHVGGAALLLVAIVVLAPVCVVVGLVVAGAAFPLRKMITPRNDPPPGTPIPY